MQERRLLGRSQITLTDTTDSRTISLYLQADNSKQVIYNPNNETYTPDYSEEPLTLTPLMYISDTDTEQALVNNIDKAKSITYSYKINSKGDWVTVTGSEPGLVREGNDLRVVSNLLDNAETVLIRVEVLYEDSNGVDVVSLAEVELIKIALGLDGTSTLLTTATPKGYFFKNGTPSSLPIEAIIYKDGSLYQGAKLVKWFRSDTSVNTTGNTLYDEDAGIGWAMVTNTTTNSKEKANEGFGEGMTTKTPTLTVYPDGVVNGQTYLVVIEDRQGVTEESKRGIILKDYVTIMDYDDPIQVVVDSSGGEVLKNGQGSTKLTAILYRNGEEIDAYNEGGNYTYTYSWSKFENNELDSTFSESGKRITVKQTDVNGKSVFKVEVREKK